MPGRLLAGEYPGSETDEQARRKVQQLLSAGVTFFLDLTEGRGGVCLARRRLELKLEETKGEVTSPLRVVVSRLNAACRA